MTFFVLESTYLKSLLTEKFIKNAYLALCFANIHLDFQWKLTSLIEFSLGPLFGHDGLRPTCLHVTCQTDEACILNYSHPQKIQELTGQTICLKFMFQQELVKDCVYVTITFHFTVTTYCRFNGGLSKKLCLKEGSVPALSG